MLRDQQAGRFIGMQRRLDHCLAAAVDRTVMQAHNFALRSRRTQNQWVMALFDGLMLCKRDSPRLP